MPPTLTDEGLQVAAQLRKSHPQTGVVLLSQFDAPVYARALLEEGSAGRAYLLKERVSDPEQLVGAIREVARGGSVIDPKVVETLVVALGELSPADGALPGSSTRPCHGWPNHSRSASSRSSGWWRTATRIRRSRASWS